ncbi:MAG: Y-family DNA polymerase, partial [Chitinophagaceae bacterium]
MKAIVDCNSFYCSCERLFRPDLHNKPVVVLSNNDGCIISRTDEAKALGIGMAGPYYQAKQQILQHGVAVFSSNYNLYGDLSGRVMESMRQMMPPGTVEVYSVDEAFLDLQHLPQEALPEFAFQLRQRVETWTGIAVSVGIAPSKTLAKVANRLAKKNKQATNCMMVLDNETSIQEALQRTSVGDIWGIGRRYARKLQEQYHIENAWQLRQMNDGWARNHLGGVVGVRMLRELRGEDCVPMKDPLIKKQMIATTRMFGKAVYELHELKEAVATYTSRAAEKLRRQHSAAGSINVFVVTNETTNEQYAYNPSGYHAFTLLP